MWNFFSLLPGDDGISQTVQIIKQAVNYGLHQPQIRQRAELIVASCAEKDELCEVGNIFQWVKNHFHYMNDPRGIEFVKSPEISDAEITKNGSFVDDCDGVTAYIACLLKSIGYAVRAVVISVPGKGPQYRHIYPEVFLPKREIWVALECTAKQKPIGWKAPQERRREYDL
jgi:hypothetical protein